MSSSRGAVRVPAVLSFLPLVWACGGVAGEHAPSGDRDVDAAQVAALVRTDSVRRADEKLSAALREQLAEAPPESRLEVVIDLRDQVDPVRLAAFIEARSRNRRERRALAIHVTGRVADASQRRLRRTLDSLAGAGAVGAFRGFTVMNRLVVDATPAALDVLSRSAEVSRIAPALAREPESPTYRARAAERHAEETRPSGQEARGPSKSKPWALSVVGADSAWRLGLTGAGIVIGLVDAGASASHEQLRANFRGGAASWYDPRRRTASPTDALQGHGTGILSLAVGRAAPGGRATGVAPGATWVACVGLPEGRYDAVRVTECAEWIFATAQPDVLIAPWLIADTSCDRSLEAIVNAWRAAEILPVFAAGNEGPAPRTGGSPANYVGLYPGDAAALSVGGVGRDGRVAALSSRGPNVCDGSVYPTLVAPAEDLTVAYPLSPTMYVRTSGTSYAAALVAGAAALLLERHPNATVVELEQALRDGARDAGARGADNDHGFGILNVPRAVAALDRVRGGGRPGDRSHDLRADRKQ